MQRVYTPRVKDGRISNESPNVHYYGKTAQSFKFDQNAVYYVKYNEWKIVHNTPKTNKPKPNSRKYKTPSKKKYQ